ncbi:MAG: metallopeptidase TldD-related protein, partial [Thermoplasmata archaeon]
IISNGILKTYLHSYSTAKKFSTSTTGNAGIISPAAFQISMDAGRKTLEDMISETKNGIFIGNSWYLRFQDERNGLFSTVPRDGVYHIVNGKFAEEWNGLRVSESFPGLLKRIMDVSTERKRIKWWNEIMPSQLPFVKIGEVNISKAF